MHSAAVHLHCALILLRHTPVYSRIWPKFGAIDNPKDKTVTPLIIDKAIVLRYDKYRNLNIPQVCFFPFGEIHISQAQVSRLEKGALAHIRDGLA